MLWLIMMPQLRLLPCEDTGAGLRYACINIYLNMSATPDSITMTYRRA